MKKMKFCEQYQEMLGKAKVKTDDCQDDIEMNPGILHSIKDLNEDVVMMVEWNISNSLSQCEPIEDLRRGNRICHYESQEYLEISVPSIDYIAQSVLTEEEVFLQKIRSNPQIDHPFQGTMQLLSLRNNTYQQIESIIKTGLMPS